MKDIVHVLKVIQEIIAIIPVCKNNICLKRNIFFIFEIIVTTPTTSAPVATPPRPLLTPQTVGLVGPKKGQLIDYGRLLGARAGPIGWLLAPLAALLLIPLALAFAARKCTQGACLPGGGRYIPVTTGRTGATQTEQGIIIIKF